MRRVASSIYNTCNIMYRCSFVFRELSLSLFLNIGVGIITQKYLSFQSILKRSAVPRCASCCLSIYQECSLAIQVNTCNIIYRCSFVFLELSLSFFSILTLQSNIIYRCPFVFLELSLSFFSILTLQS